MSDEVKKSYRPDAGVETSAEGRRDATVLALGLGMNGLGDRDRD